MIESNMKKTYITVKGKLSKYCVKSEDNQYYFLTQVQNSNGYGYFLLKLVGNEYLLIKQLRLG